MIREDVPSDQANDSKLPLFFKTGPMRWELTCGEVEKSVSRLISCLLMTAD